MVYRVYILHTILHHPPHLLQTLVPAHRRHRVALHQDIAARQQLQRFERAPIRPQYPLPALHKALLVAHQVADLDDVGRHAVLQDLDRLRERHRPRKQLDQVPRLEDRRGVVRLARRAHRHGALDEIERACDLVLLERPRHERPGFTKVHFAVFGEERGEGGFFGEGAGFVVVGFEFVNL